MLLSGCAGAMPFGSKEGTLSLRGRGQGGDLEDFFAVVVKVSRIELVPSGGDGPEPATITVPFNRQSFDLVAHSEGDGWVFVNETRTAGTYTQVKLQVDSASGTLKSGDRAKIDFDQVLSFETPVTVTAKAVSSFAAALTVERTDGDTYRLVTADEA